ncbi:MAG TPA: 4'-phosphopantetheinyl transferase superfamily protein [Actinocrinis sp.]|uniref:4'-phosphopantetheinyl transferase family protein n=1 Tax=Actinocrinis sp. TaxID=1920516 RepID=UPI002D435AE7|nr:4'-phosphopantetheinyl transferase superfamily protein [Actinocrinis sp.]HZU54910.1 4'-phosphopantetheinyl transferase superfamily protein [Actinocrinis sp.]
MSTAASPDRRGGPVREPRSRRGHVGEERALRWLARGEQDLPQGGDWLSERESEVCARMRFTKRRREFQTARWAAKQAMAALPGCALDPALLEVRHHPTGAPEAWADRRALPVGISLSDRAGWAVCLLGLEPGAVGCDLELVEPRSAAFVRDYFTAAERRFIRDDDLRANLLWSAKESALKVLRTGLRRDTRTVEVSVTMPATRFAEDSGWCPLTVRVDRARTFTGWWARYNDFLLTVATAAPTPPPVGIDAIAALTAATPVHSWLDAPVSAVRPHVPSLAPTRR